MIAKSFSHRGKIIIAGNGGSAADAEHIAGELMKNFSIKRKFPNTSNTNDEFSNLDSEIADYLISRLQPGLPAISLSNHSSINTACINDIDSDIIYAQQVYIYGNEGDIF